MTIYQEQTQPFQCVASHRLSEWQWCLQQSCSKKLCISIMWSVWLTPDKCHCQAVFCSALHILEKKKKVKTSCPWVESHCGQPAPQVPCHPVLSWTVLWGWSLCYWRGLSQLWLCIILFLPCACMYAATYLPHRRGSKLSPSLLLCISLELINSLGLYDWGIAWERWTPSN